MLNKTKTMQKFITLIAMVLIVSASAQKQKTEPAAQLKFNPDLYKGGCYQGIIGALDIKTGEEKEISEIQKIILDGKNYTIFSGLTHSSN